jgi:polyhydroxyalkanoate synthesis repressor PhaR
VDESKSEEPVRIKKYANRRLYNTATSSYVTLDDLAKMVKDGSDFVVHDAKTGEDITHSVLTQIIFEQETKGQNLLPIPFLRQLIRFYGDSMQSMVPSYLELSLGQLAKEQSKFRRSIADAFGTGPMEIMEGQVRQNLTMFNDALKMFTPFGGVPGAGPGTGAGAGNGPAEARAAPEKGRDDDISTLKDQLSAMQAQLDRLAGAKKD